MKDTEKLAQLRRLQTKTEALRLDLGISAPGEILYQSDFDFTSDEILIVEADGFGGATTRIVEGNYPLDYCTKFEKYFTSEEEAETVAEQVVNRKRSPNQALASAT